jgi:hypothetical protein
MNDQTAIVLELLHASARKSEELARVLGQQVELARQLQPLVAKITELSRQHHELQADIDTLALQTKLANRKLSPAESAVAEAAACRDRIKTAEAAIARYGEALIELERTHV